MRVYVCVHVHVYVLCTYIMLLNKFVHFAWSQHHPIIFTKNCKISHYWNWIKYKYIRASPVTTIQWSVQIAIVQTNAANIIDMVITNRTRRWNKYSSYKILRSSRSNPPNVEVDIFVLSPLPLCSLDTLFSFYWRCLQNYLSRNLFIFCVIYFLYGVVEYILLLSKLIDRIICSVGWFKYRIMK